MSGITRNLVLSSELDHQITKVAKTLGLSRSATMRLLMQRALGIGTARLFVDEKTLEVKNLLAKRIRMVIDQGLRQELHALVDEVNPPMSSSLIEDDLAEPETEQEVEPEAAPMKGRPRKAAKARRR
jgi:hypothetical protein